MLLLLTLPKRKSDARLGSTTERPSTNCFSISSITARPPGGVNGHRDAGLAATCPLCTAPAPRLPLHGRGHAAPTLGHIGYVAPRESHPPSPGCKPHVPVWMHTWSNALPKLGTYWRTRLLPYTFRASTLAANSSCSLYGSTIGPSVVMLRLSAMPAKPHSVMGGRGREHTAALPMCKSAGHSTTRGRGSSNPGL